jgi:CheY-like chemotaxis protein
MFAEIGFAGYLPKPVARRDLKECLMLVLAVEQEDWHLRSQPMVTRHVLRAERARGRYRILVAEDNVVNQKVALRFLEKLGCRADCVSNGKAAITAWESVPYDLILMDCQMPELDGYEATRQIRSREAGKRHIPIIALTAHAMKGADVDCLAAGMDDYLTKPLDPMRLKDILERMLPAYVAPSMPTSPASAESNNKLQARLLEITGNDWEFASELLSAFVLCGEEMLTEMRRASQAGDLKALAAACHKLKGASANLRIEQLHTLTAELEVRARAGDSGDREPALERIREEVELAVRSFQAALQTVPRETRDSEASRRGDANCDKAGRL